MKVVFRADASLAIGTGHIMRCLTLANALTAEGATCQFICRAHVGHLADLIRRFGFSVHLLPFDSNWVAPNRPIPTHAAWLGTDWQIDAEQTRKVLDTETCDWLIVDHYAVDERWESALKFCCQKLMVIDDLADRSHVCDLLLDQNWYGSRMTQRYDKLIPVDTIKLLGPEYALLRPEYGQLRTLMPPRDGLVRRVLVFMGGSDLSNETAKVLRALMAEDLLSLAVDVVIGANYPDRAGILALASARPATTLYQSLPSLAALMVRADLMISAGGSTTWERMCLGLPCLVISIANNQTESQQALEAAGYNCYLGEMSQVSPDNVSDAVKQLISEPGKLVEQGRKCQILVNGSGASRISKIMGKKLLADSKCFR